MLEAPKWTAINLNNVVTQPCDYLLNTQYFEMWFCEFRGITVLFEVHSTLRCGFVDFEVINRGITKAVI